MIESKVKTLRIAICDDEAIILGEVASCIKNIPIKEEGLNLKFFPLIPQAHL